MTTPDAVTLRTDRLLLRPWRSEDRPLFAALNADPKVMDWFPATMTREESDALVDRIEQRFREFGWGLWAVEVPGVAPFIGFVGLNPAEATLGYPCVEIGWRLAAQYWGRGYAPEGAVAALRFGFDTLQLDEIVSFTSVANAKSRRVMIKIGMTRNAEDDFDHPRLAATSPLLRHVLYRIKAAEFSAREETESV
ncbi:MAG TPA: GNAT family N-acetyltransferase [Candidatus Dormibacteraeota bacterium]